MKTMMKTTHNTGRQQDVDQRTYQLQKQETNHEQQVLTENKMGMGRTSGKNISVHLEKRWISGQGLALHRLGGLQFHFSRHLERLISFQIRL